MTFDNCDRWTLSERGVNVKFPGPEVRKRGKLAKWVN